MPYAFSSFPFLSIARSARRSGRSFKSAAAAGPGLRATVVIRQMSAERCTAVLGAAREGSEAAWAEIYRELSPALLGYLRVSGEPEPEDALGEIFLQVARDIGGFEGSWPKFRSWVFTIAHHRMIDAGRRRSRRPVELVPETPEPQVAPVDQAA